MTIPITFGWPQVILIIVGLFGLWLFITAGMRMRGRRLDEDELEEYKRSGRPRQRRFRFQRAIGGIVLLALAVSLLWLTFLVQSYLGLTGDIQVAKVRAVPVANVLHEMSVELTVFDSNGHQTTNTYVVQGDEWMLEGDIIKFPTWLNILGLHSGYKLTRLEGRYDVPKLEQSAPRTVVELNGGDDNFFKTMHDQRGWIRPFVDATYGNAVFSPAGATYDVYVSQTGLFDRSSS